MDPDPLGVQLASTIRRLQLQTSVLGTVIDSIQCTHPHAYAFTMQYCLIHQNFISDTATRRGVLHCPLSG